MVVKGLKIMAAGIMGLFWTCIGHATVILVPENQPTIQACINAANPGDICSVAPGTYTETPTVIIGGQSANINLDKAVTLRSRELFGAILDGVDRTSLFIVVRASALIEGFVIKNAAGGVVQRASTDVGWTARNLIITGCNYGIGIDQETGRLGSAVLYNIVSDGNGVGFYTNDANSLHVYNCIASYCEAGFEGCQHNSFTVDYSLLFGNTTNCREGCPDNGTFLPAFGANMLYADPRFSQASVAGKSFPYLLHCTSPAVDAGMPDSGLNDVTFPPAWGTARSDIGAYGGPGAFIALSDAERQELAGQFLRLYPSGDGTVLTWCKPPGSTGSDVVRGNITVLQLGHGDFSSATKECAGDDLVLDSMAYPGAPQPGQAYWFAVRCEGCPGHGTYDSGSPSQIGSRDPGIAASGFDCP